MQEVRERLLVTWGRAERAQARKKVSKKKVLAFVAAIRERKKACGAVEQKESAQGSKKGLALLAAIRERRSHLQNCSGVGIFSSAWRF
jgi:hypothetical protein